jgi:DNA-binding PadR family transcriptional regulator
MELSNNRRAKTMNVDDEIPTSSLHSDLRRHATMAMEITGQDWLMLGHGDKLCPNVAASASLEVTTERVTSLLLIRLVAIVAPSHRFKDLSTTTICQTMSDSRYITSYWPEAVTETVTRELTCFVRAIFQGYNRVPYHNFEHAYQVIISANKLMDLVLQSASLEPVQCSSESLRFDEDPLMHLALLFGALIHDVEHQGVPNKQLVLEKHPLALQYNDQSIAEQRSLTIGFTELLKPAYDNLRQVMFPSTFSGDGYRCFREAVTNLILATDIATPERGEIVRKKWDTAFEGPSSEPLLRVIDKNKSSRKEEMLAAPLLQPPNDHPTPNHQRRKKSVKEVFEKKKDPPVKPPSDSWVELGSTPSTHFQRDTGPSMHDSLAFWWFCPDELNGDEDSDSHGLLEDGTAFVPASVQEMTLSDNSFNEDFEASITLFPEPEKNLWEDYSCEHTGTCVDFGISTQIEEEVVDEKLRTMSLLEHILLVSDVAHTMQSWDIMEKFAYRLAEEIQTSITEGRSGGIIDDPLSDWYSNQSAFLHGYILPLTQRLEKTGFIPTASEDRGEWFLSKLVRNNLNRWQEQGHDIILAWRRDRDKEIKKKKIKTKKKKKKKTRKMFLSKGSKDRAGKNEVSKSVDGNQSWKDHPSVIIVQDDDILVAGKDKNPRAVREASYPDS